MQNFSKLKQSNKYATRKLKARASEAEEAKASTARDSRTLPNRNAQ